MKIIKLDYYTNLLVKDENLLPTMKYLLEAKLVKNNQVEEVNFTLEDAPDMMATAVREVEQYKKWWLEEKEKNKKLEASVKIPKNTDEEIPF